MRRYPVPFGYLAGLTVVSAIYVQVLSPEAQRSFVAWASTNLNNLSWNPVGTLVVSAFIAEDSVIAWLIVGSIALFPLARRFGNRRATLLIGGAHVIGTLLSQGLLAWQMAVGSVPESARGDIDIGPSYVVAAALVAVILYGPSRWSRALALVGWIALVPTLFEGLTSLEVSGVGHFVSMVTGALIGGVFVAREKARRPAVEAPASAVQEARRAPIPG
ncbi:MAG: hypothetical protein JWN52_6494 [Actinomycetia bacterium]|nr:hypothetical protein [Actinomycetes bacterium]